jgi:serine/threonine protein kinase
MVPLESFGRFAGRRTDKFCVAKRLIISACLRKRESNFMPSLRSYPHIVGYYHREHLKSSQDLHLYMEYCGNGDLGRVIRDLQAKKQLADEGFVWSMFAQLVTALYRCHYGVDPPDAGSDMMGLGNTAKPKSPAAGVMILHRDLKPENGTCPNLLVKCST